MSSVGCQAVPDVLLELLQALARDRGDLIAGLLELLGDHGAQAL